MLDTIQLGDLLYILRKRILWIILAAAVGAGITYVYTKYQVVPLYYSSISMYVNNATVIDPDYVNLSDINASKQLVDTYIVILQNEEVMEKVGEKLSVPLSVGQLRSYLSMGSINDTEVLRITAMTPDPNLSAEICNTIAEIAPEVLQRVVKAGSVEVINTAKPASMPSSPDIQRNTLTGMVIALLGSYMVFILLYLLDNTIKGEEDLKRHINIPVIGEIPNFDKYIRAGNK